MFTNRTYPVTSHIHTHTQQCLMLFRRLEDRKMYGNVSFPCYKTGETPDSFTELTSWSSWPRIECFPSQKSIWTEVQETHCARIFSKRILLITFTKCITIAYCMNTYLIEDNVHILKQKFVLLVWLKWRYINNKHRDDLQIDLIRCGPPQTLIITASISYLLFIAAVWYSEVTDRGMLSLTN